MEKEKRAKCPICNGIALMGYDMKESEDAEEYRWMHCACGVVFKSDEFSSEEYSDEEKKEHNSQKEIYARYKHYVHTYIPIIEEMAVGRRFYDNHQYNHVIAECLENRGWVSSTHKEEPQDLIFLNNTIQNSADPIALLKEYNSMLSKTGILMITTPDTDFINVLSPPRWSNWQGKHANMYFNIRSLRDQIEKVGLQVVLSTQNLSERFPFINDLHIIARKKIM